MRIASWNINSVRIRIPLLKRLVAEHGPDILCLQETKVEDASFPLEEVKSLGFPHAVFSGQKGYNGMAILSRLPLEAAGSLRLGGNDDRRHLAAVLPCGTALHNVYIPAGGDLPDPALNASFAHKLRFVEDMTAWAAAPQQRGGHMIMLGDFNIAPQEHDVWSHRQMRGVVSHTPAEVERLDALRATRDWCDVARRYVPAAEKSYSWWSYRNRDWKKSNRGRRLDHIWVTPGLVPALRAYHAHHGARDWDSPSDHIPIIMDMAL